MLLCACAMLQCTTAEGVEVDVSLNSGGGVRAAVWLAAQQEAFPALRPLVLLLKAWLKAAGLAEVAQGGLGSFALALMVIGHLQEEAKVWGLLPNLALCALAPRSLLACLTVLSGRYCDAWGQFLLLL